VISGIGVDPLMGETKLVSRAAADELALVGHIAGPVRNQEAVASHDVGLLPRRVLVGREARMAQGREHRAAAIAQQLKQTLPPGQKDPSRMDKGAELIAGSYSDSRIQAFGSQQQRFIEFCELDGYDWSEAGKHAMVAWIAYMFDSTSISGDSMEQYVSTVNRAFETSGLAPPGRPQNYNRLYAEVKRAIDGFNRARLNAGRSPFSTLQRRTLPLLLCVCSCKRN
jgi:hypothetical protein